jgi:hypothetical protein
MKGHIRERSPGLWAIVLDIRDPETGKRKRKWHSFCGIKREAQTECSRLITEFAQGSYVEPQRQRSRRFWTNGLSRSSRMSPPARMSAIWRSRKRTSSHCSVRLP